MAVTNKIDFVALVNVQMANPNGDPLNGNRPRCTYDNYGEISDVCIKRKLRNRMQEMGHKILMQSNARSDDGLTSVEARADKVINAATMSVAEIAKTACETWLDVRTFGQVLALKGEKGKGKKSKSKDVADDAGEEASGKKSSLSVGVRGPVSIHMARSVAPVDVFSWQLTKSLNGSEAGDSRSSDTMGMKHYVRHGLYVVKGSINVIPAEKTGFNDSDVEVLKQSLLTMFRDDASAARPDGSMEVVKLYWFEHNCKHGQYPTARVHRSVRVTVKPGIFQPTCLDDYDIELEALPGLVPEILDGE